MDTSNSSETQETTRYSLREANVTRQAEWDEGNQISLSFRGNEMAGEVGEACNVIKKLDRERMGIRGSRDTVEHLAEELADVVICADLIAAAVGVDLDAAVRTKFNATSEKNGLVTRLGDRKTLRCIVLTGAEVQSGTDRQAWAEGLIAQLPPSHDGRNSWLMNYGVGPEAQILRQIGGHAFNPVSRAINPPVGE